MVQRIQGTITPIDETGEFVSSGIAEVTDNNHIRVTELPVGMCTDTFEKDLRSMRNSYDKKHKMNVLVSIQPLEVRITLLKFLSKWQDFANNSGDVNVELVIEVDESNLTKAEDMGLLKAFNMYTSINTDRMLCFDKDDKIRKYESPEDILREFYDLHLDYYIKIKVQWCSGSKRFSNSN
jgi:DNA topoisomerase-2